MRNSRDHIIIISTFFHHTRIGCKSTSIYNYRRKISSIYRIFYFKDLAKKKIIDNPCIDCESEIPQARLENVENAIRCASCQEKYELEHPESVARKAAENPIGSREDFKNMSNKQFGTNSKTKF
jgi:RNA polymerase-binding transcription factor DksA